MNAIEAIKERVGIEECLAHFGVEVPPRGRDPVMVRCPWHEDRSPSMAVYRKQGRVWCYGCNRGGDVLDVTAAFISTDARGALQYWTRRLGIEPRKSLVPQEREALAREARARMERQAIRRVCHRFSHEIERYIPRPTDPDLLSLWDACWQSKDAIDEAVWKDGGPSTRAEASEYIEELGRWCKVWRNLLSGASGTRGLFWV